MNERYDPYGDSYYESGYADQTGRYDRQGYGSMRADRGGSGPHFYDPAAASRGRGPLPDLDEDDDYDDEPSNWRRRAAMIAIGGGAAALIGGGAYAVTQFFGKGTHPDAAAADATAGDSPAPA